MVGSKVLSSTSNGGGFFYQKVDVHEENRILYYKRFLFGDMDEPYLKGNKEGNRPHYYCFEDSFSGLYWMIPLSSRIDKYRKFVRYAKSMLHMKVQHVLHVDMLLRKKY